MMDMSGKVALVTGASRGIGAAAARQFASQGASVVLVARSEGAIREIATEIGEAAIAVAADVSSKEDMAAAVAEAANAFGGLDYLCNNAGILEPIGMLEEMDPDDFARVMAVNINGVFNGIHAAMPEMRKRGGGVIVTISSGAAHGPMEGWGHYCTSKAAVNMLTRAVHRENAGSGIRALGLSPGTVDTEMQVAIKKSGVNAVSKLERSDHIPPEWPARAITWMCEPDIADEFDGQEISLRDETIRRRIGLI